MSTMLERAIALAEKAHEGQVRKGNGQPYITHPKAVLKKVQGNWYGFNNDEIVYSAAILHDVLEDCPQISEEMILKATDKTVLDYVKGLTNPTHGSRLHRDVRKEIDRIYLSMAVPEIKMIKICDRIENLLDVHSLDRDFQLIYTRESFLLLNALGEGKGTCCSENMIRLYWELEDIIYNLLRG